MISLFLLGNRPGAHAQGARIVYGQPRPEDFDLKGVPFDSGANAVIIADIGSTSIENNSRNFCGLRYTRLTRVKILNKNGFNVSWMAFLANRRFLGTTEKLVELKGVTYNRQNGLITRHELAAGDVYDTKVAGEVGLKSFTMPDLEEGSVYDLSYTITSDAFTNLRTWNFQSQYPCLWSEYSVSVPSVLHYVMRETGEGNYAVNEQHETFERYVFYINRPFEFAGDCLHQRWARTDIPSSRSENYVSDPENFAPSIRFQLQYIKFSNGYFFEEFSNWFKTSSELMSSHTFGWPLTDLNPWMDAELKIIIGTEKIEEEQARRIYTFVRDHFSCVPNGSLGLTKKLKEIYHNRSGSESEINLLLVALLKHAGLDAFPMLLSTRNHGIPQSVYPMMSEFNYVAAVYTNIGRKWLLDASSQNVGFGKLQNECYNGQGRVIDEKRPFLVDLSADSLTETETTAVFIDSDSNHVLSGFCNQVLGDAGSETIRHQIHASGGSEYIKSLSSAGVTGVDVSNLEVDSVEHQDYPVSIHFEFKYGTTEKPDIIYFNPMLIRKYAKNPFAARTRYFPIEMPYRENDVYILSMDIPKGYKIDEMPAAVRIELEDRAGFFEYLLQYTGERIEMRVWLKLNKATFPAEEYQVLRDFYSRVVAKENEQIVFRKIK